MADVDNGMNAVPPPASGTPAPPAGAPTPDRHRSGQAATGIMLIVIGAVFFADRLGWDWGWQWHPTFAHMWPILLIVMGLSRIMSPSDGGRHTRSGRYRSGRRFGGGGWILIVGILLLLDQNRWLSLRESWPLFIIAGGLSMLLERRFGGN